jgi:hypothetical protein
MDPLPIPDWIRNAPDVIDVNDFHLPPGSGISGPPAGAFLETAAAVACASWSAQRPTPSTAPASTPAKGRAMSDYTHARYVLDQCRCDDCRAANRAYERHRARWVGEFPYVDPPLVPAGPSRRHVQALMRDGMGLKRISAVSGVPHGVLWKLVYGKKNSRGVQRKSRRVRRETAEALLATDLDLAAGARVDATEAWAIVDELQRRGWTKNAIGRQIAGPKARTLQMSQHLVQVSTLKTLRRLLTEPVPPKGHRTGPIPPPPVEFRQIPATTRGVPAPDQPAVTRSTGRGGLTCKICGDPLAQHSLTSPCGGSLAEVRYG